MPQASETPRRQPGVRIMHGLGIAFCVLLAATMILFPLLKREPVGLLPVVAGLLASALVLHRPVRRGLNRLVQAGRPGRFLLVVLLLALLARLGYCAAVAHKPGSDDNYYHVSAVDLLDGKGYLYMGGQPTAFYPPGNSMRLAAWYAITSPHYLSGWGMNALLGCALVWMTWRFCAAAFADPAVARWAALLMAVHPAAVASSAGLGYGTLLSCLLVGSFLLAMRAGESSGRRSLAYVAAAGLVLGAGCLVKPICLLVPGILVITWLRMGVRWRRSVGWAVACALVMAAVVAPWTIRNYRVFGAFVPVSTNGGQALYTANNPQSKGMYMRVDAMAEDLDPTTGLVDEVRRDRHRRQLALAWITEHPGDWLAIWPHKLSYLWGSMAGLSHAGGRGAAAAAGKAFLNASWAFVLLPLAVGTFRRRAWAVVMFAPLGLLILYLTGLHIFFESGCRHAAVALPAIMALAAAGLAINGGDVETRR